MICVGNMYEANFSNVNNNAVYAGMTPMANANKIFFCILVAEFNNVLKSIIILVWHCKYKNKLQHLAHSHKILVWRQILSGGVLP